MVTATETATVLLVPHLIRGYEQVAEGYRQKIRTGELKAGDKLPGIRKIAKEEWGTTPNTVARAIRVLRDEGWIEVNERQAAFVIGIPSGGS